MRRTLLPGLIILLSATLVIGTCVVLFTPVMQVRDIRVIRTDLRTDVDQVRKTLAPLFRRHLFFLPRREVTAMLETNMPEIETVDVEKRYPSTLAVRITLEPLIAELRVLDADGNQGTGSGVGIHSYLSDKGMYLEYGEVQIGSPLRSSGATAGQASSMLPKIDIVDWGVRPLPRTILLNSDMLTDLRKAEQAILDQFGQPVRSRTIFLRAREFHLQTTGHALWFDTASPLEEQIERYKIFLQAAGKDAAKEYVDLRLKDRIVYK